MKRSTKRAIATFIAIFVSVGSMSMVRANELSEAEARLAQLLQTIDSLAQYLNVTLRAQELEAGLCVQRYISETDPNLIIVREGCQQALDRIHTELFYGTRQGGNLTTEIQALRARIEQLKSTPTPTPEASASTEQGLPVQPNQNSNSPQQHSGNSGQPSRTDVSTPVGVAVAPNPIASSAPSPTPTPFTTPSSTISPSPQPALPTARTTPTPTPFKTPSSTISPSPQPALPSTRISPTPTSTVSLSPGAKARKTPTPTPTVSTRKNGKVASKTITCVRGDNVRKVKAVKPVCPRGFKQKVS